MIILAVFYRLQLFFFGFAAAAGCLVAIGLFSAQQEASSTNVAATPERIITPSD